ncbi:MAG TPA: hypothetical protein VFZ65_12370, partial [Planctomycetota bacterium]|nr:hypothetical protein [Planctomycetota bacterium]
MQFLRSLPFVPSLCLCVAALAWLAPGLAQQPVVVAMVWSALLLAAGDGAWRIASRLLPAASTSVFLLGAALLFESIAAGTVTLLGAAAVFRLPVVAAGLAGLGFAVHRRAGAPRRLAQVLSGLPFGRGFAPPVAGLSLLLLGAFAVVATNQLRYTVQDADSMWYHLVMPAEWVRTGSIRPIAAIPSMGIGYPGFRQALLAFLSLAPRNEHLALLGLLEFPLLAMAVYGLARHFGGSTGMALGAGVHAAMTPVALGSLSTQGNDLSLAIHLLLSLLFVARFFASGGRGEGLLAGLALGALMAIKFSGPGYAAIAVLVLLLQHGFRPWWSWRGLGVLALGALVLAAPWYVRNLCVFGNPLWPAKLYLGDTVLFDGVYDKAYFREYMLGWNVQPLLDHLDHFVIAHGWLVPVAAGAAPFVLAAVLLRRWRGREAFAAGLLSPLLFVAFLHHPFNAPWFDAGYTHRYLIAWFCVSSAVAAAALSRLLPGRLPAGWVWAAGACLGLATVTRVAWPIALLAVAGTGVLLAARARRQVERVFAWLVARRLPAVAGWLLVGALAFGAGTLRARWQYDPDVGYRDGLSERGWGPCVAWVHQNVHGARVGMHGSFFFFPLLGEPWSNEVFVADDLVLKKDFKTPEQVAAWAEDRRLDYLVCCLYRS